MSTALVDLGLSGIWSISFFSSLIDFFNSSGKKSLICPTIESNIFSRWQYKSTITCSFSIPLLIFSFPSFSTPLVVSFLSDSLLNSSCFGNVTGNFKASFGRSTWGALKLILESKVGPKLEFLVKNFDCCAEWRGFVDFSLKFSTVA